MFYNFPPTKKVKQSKKKSLGRLTEELPTGVRITLFIEVENNRNREKMGELVDSKIIPFLNSHILNCLTVQGLVFH